MAMAESIYAIEVIQTAVDSGAISYSLRYKWRNLSHECEKIIHDLKEVTFLNLVSIDNDSGLALSNSLVAVEGVYSRDHQWYWGTLWEY